MIQRLEGIRQNLANADLLVQKPLVTYDPTKFIRGRNLIDRTLINGPFDPNEFKLLESKTSYFGTQQTRSFGPEMATFLPKDYTIINTNNTLNNQSLLNQGNNLNNQMIINQGQYGHQISQGQILNTQVINQGHILENQIYNNNNHIINQGQVLNTSQSLLNNNHGHIITNPIINTSGYVNQQTYVPNNSQIISNNESHLINQNIPQNIVISENLNTGSHNLGNVQIIPSNNNMINQNIIEHVQQPITTTNYSSEGNNANIIEHQFSEDEFTDDEEENNVTENLNRMNISNNVFSSKPQFEGIGQEHEINVKLDGIGKSNILSEINNTKINTNDPRIKVNINEIEKSKI